MIRTVACAVVLLLTAAPAVGAELYRWRDADGRLHYTDTPPPAGARDAERVQFRSSAPEGEGLPYAVQLAAKNFPVTLYATDCGDTCERARELLRRRGVPFAEKNPRQNLEEAQALAALTGGQMVVPVLVVGRSATIKGYAQGSWDEALDAAGYPKGATESPGRARPALQKAAKPGGEPENKTGEPAPASGKPPGAIPPPPPGQPY